MALDINKIIKQSIQETENIVTESEEIVSLEDNDNLVNNNVDNEANINSACVASAISAGLGAMTFRNKLSRLSN
jgi:mannitol-specific phosphotransferase system IIBC component